MYLELKSDYDSYTLVFIKSCPFRVTLIIVFNIFAISQCKYCSVVSLILQWRNNIIYHSFISSLLVTTSVLYRRLAAMSLPYLLSATSLRHFSRWPPIENRIYREELKESLGMNFFSPFQPEREFKVYKSCKC